MAQVKKIENIKTTINYRDGLFGGKNMKTIAIVLNELIKKSNEQTEAINNLIDSQSKDGEGLIIKKYMI